MKKLLPAEREIIDHLYERVLFTLKFIDDAEGLGATGDQMRSVVQLAHSKGDLRGMRLLARDIDALTIALPDHQREGLEALLKARLSVDKDAERADLKRSVRSALKRGTVGSEKERRHLEDYVEMLESIGGDPAEIRAVPDLISRG